MAVDRGKDNPLVAAIEQTPGLTIVRTLPTFEPPYFKLGVILPRTRERRGIAFAPGETLFVALEPKSYVIAELEDRTSGVALKTPGVGHIFHPYENTRLGALYFGGIPAVEQLPSFKFLKGGSSSIEDPELRAALEEAQKRPGAKKYRTGSKFDLTRTSYAAIYPSMEVATLAADLHEYSLTHEGPAPLHSFPLAHYGALSNLSIADTRRLAAATDELPIIQEIGARYIPGYSPNSQA